MSSKMVDWKSKPDHLCTIQNSAFGLVLDCVFICVRLVWSFQSSIFEVIGLPQSKPIYSLYTLREHTGKKYNAFVNWVANFGEQFQNLKFRIMFWHIFGGWKNNFENKLPSLIQGLAGYVAFPCQLLQLLHLMWLGTRHVCQKPD